VLYSRWQHLLDVRDVGRKTCTLVRMKLDWVMFRCVTVSDTDRTILRMKKVKVEKKKEEEGLRRRKRNK